MKILFVGLGNLGSQVFDLFVLRAQRGDQFLVGGRNLEYLRERTRWTAAAALQLGIPVQIETTSLDVWNIDQTAQTIATFKPEVIFSSVTVQRSSIISQLPRPYFEQLAKARSGPWMPLTLVLVYKLMQAVKHTGLPITVLNGGSPDNAHAVLGKVGLAPTSGIGNLALAVPPLKQALAVQFYRPLERVQVLVFAHSYVMQQLRKGTTGGAPIHLSAFVDGEEITNQLDLPTLLGTLPATLEHEYTQLLTAATAATVFDAVTGETQETVHAPGPRGLPGAYPFRIENGSMTIVLPPRFSLEEAIRINQEGQRSDGIERIDDDGTVYFAEQNMAILKEVIGYECRGMPLSEVESWARELHARYRTFAGQVGVKNQTG
jgi:hypothetical protein